jgi:hypothetical protein
MPSYCFHKVNFFTKNVIAMQYMKIQSKQWVNACGEMLLEELRKRSWHLKNVYHYSNNLEYKHIFMF